MVGHGTVINAWPIYDADHYPIATLTLYQDCTVTLGSTIMPETEVDPEPILQMVSEAAQYIAAVQLLQPQLQDPS